MVKKIVVLASGSGSNFQALIDRFSTPESIIKIVGLIASKASIKAIHRADNAAIPTFILPSIRENKVNFEEQMLNQLISWKPDLIVLAGFLSLIPPKVIQRWPNAIINIHPALLPKFGGKGMYGMNVHEAVIQAKEKVSGCTVHYVTEFYDEGAIIAQKEVAVLPNDTVSDLAAKILVEEHKLLPKVVERILLP